MLNVGLEVTLYKQAVFYLLWSFTFTVLELDTDVELITQKIFLGGVEVWWWCCLSDSVFSLCYSGMSRHWRLVVSPCDVL